MPHRILLAHAPEEEDVATEVAAKLGDAGFEVSHRGTVMVGASVTEEASKLLQAGVPLVLCGTIKAAGTGWANRLVHAARQRPDGKIFALKMEEEAYLDGLLLDAVPAAYWQDAIKAMDDLVVALKAHLGPAASVAGADVAVSAELRYRELALESCDIIDLASLPEDDRHLAQRQLELRRLYVALRVRIETMGAESEGDKLDEIEKRRQRERAAVRGPDEQDLPGDRVPVGERLGKVKRLVVLGDPGSGKTTMIRWIATAYLLRLKLDPDWRDLPDIATLPDADLLPIVVRCRDLEETEGNSLDVILRHTLRKSEMSELEVQSLRSTLRTKLEDGKAILLLDGLDEISDPGIRAKFCRQIEQITMAFPNAPIIATSRIVGYREMGVRIGRGFEHVTVADLSADDKDDFAKRWCAITEPPERVGPAIEDLIEDIHSTDRIERLTGNPMLLTTMALVKRKVGKLPSRRADLYWEAVTVLLNWRREVDDPIDHREAVPQLEYIAYAMCDRGVQSLREDELLDLLVQMRREYPQVHAIQARPPGEFLEVLERRTGILVRVGYQRHHGKPEPVFEFRHLTFQEYLAGLALVEGRFPGRDRSLSLAERVAPLAARTKSTEGFREVAVTEVWREALRLCVASCNDDDVDNVLAAILRPQPYEDVEQTRRARAALAALCLADEPNASDAIASEILDSLVSVTKQEDGAGTVRSTVDQAVVQLGNTRWGRPLETRLVGDYLAQPYPVDLQRGGLAGMIGGRSAPTAVAERDAWASALVARLKSDDRTTRVAATLAIMDAAFIESWVAPPEIVRLLSGRLSPEVDDHERVAVAWALGWVSTRRPKGEAEALPQEVLRDLVEAATDPSLPGPAHDFLGWLINNYELKLEPAAAIAKLEGANPRVRASIARMLGNLGGSKAIPSLASLAKDPDFDTSVAAMNALADIGGAEVVPLLAEQMQRPAVTSVATRAIGKIGGSLAAATLRAALESEEASTRRAALGGLAQMEKDHTDKTLLSKDLDAFRPYIDCAEPIDDNRVEVAAHKAGLSVDEIKARYEALAQRLPLKIAWT